MSDQKSVSMRVSGRVQGVAYRAWARDQAEELGLVGWVRNEDDGSVSAYIAGPAKLVDEMIARMRRGPRAASVADIVVRDVSPDPAMRGFRITR